MNMRINTKISSCVRGKFKVKKIEPLVWPSVQSDLILDKEPRFVF